MGGSSKRSGRGGGGGSGRSGDRHPPQAKRLKKDPGVPDLREVSRKLIATAQRKSHSVMSLRSTSADTDVGNNTARDAGSRLNVSGGGAIRGSAADKMGQMVARRLAQERARQRQREHGQSSWHAGKFPSEDAEGVSEEIRLANQRRQMATLALRVNEKVHHYEEPLRAFYNNSESMDGDYGGSDMLLEDVDRRGTDKSLRRFFKEFHRVVESCDVLLQVLDARDPLGCRLTKLEQSIRSSYGDDKKKIVVVLNKVDMLPSKEVVDAWIHYFEEREHLTCVPFAATAKGSVGQSYTHNMFRKLRSLARGDSADGSDRKAIVVGVIGYPNVGKSSIINALKRKNVVGVGNMPGFTTGNTEVELRSDIRVMDCPGVVMPGEDNGDVVLRGAVRVSDLANPFTPVQRLLQRCAAMTDVDLGAQCEGHNEEEEGPGGHGGGAMRVAHHVHPLAQFYTISSFRADDVMEFIRLVGLRRGRLTKGGHVDEEATARMILDDWNSGRIAYYTYPPADDDFFAGNNFHAARQGDEGGIASAAAGGSGGADATFVSGTAKGITLDGLPTFHLSMRSVTAGKGSRKKWVTAYRDQGIDGVEEHAGGEDDDVDRDDDDDDVL